VAFPSFYMLLRRFQAAASLGSPLTAPIYRKIPAPILGSLLVELLPLKHQARLKSARSRWGGPEHLRE